MKILILTQYFPPEFGAAATRNSEHARFWAEAGHAVEVCTGMPNYPAGVVHEAYRGKWYVREEKDGYVVHRAWIYATPNRAVWRRALASLTFLVSGLICGVCKCRRPDVVIASSGPFFVGPLGWLLSVIKRAAFVFEVRDLLPQQAIDVGMIRNPLAIALLKSIEAFLYRRAKRIVAVAPASAKALADRGFDANTIVTIENGIRSDFFVPAPRENDIRAQYGWQDRFIAMYIGAHGVSQGLFTLLEAAERLADLEDVRFVFVGDGADKPRMVEWAKTRGLRNVEFLPLQDKDLMPAFYAAADACFVPLRKGDYFRINIPSKIFEIMACARPVILGAEGQALDILQQAGGGIPVAPEDPEAFAEAVRRLRADPALAGSLGANGRAYVVEHFDRRRKAADYIKALTM
ncbi:MAG TPA: glycosyltransferase family 4 protein [Candidatus Hydrogenedentes bacterium]|nr:glycosyltransferase family 4 protein [Candidatus Hydrogenedentota bacterium]HPC15691.1 glycosyltransferase family 4 protein [Candidatus Hydrogenedentota bacterium]HRT19685.1 glycosyltransferase family 4 protein [Candidatus Hydrogenedentota bacterium]HRT64459.1 glycosyltransferase family 4 protein [Candidatus Hydrogenedentota bacterium]